MDLKNFPKSNGTGNLSYGVTSLAVLESIVHFSMYQLQINLCYRLNVLHNMISW